MRDQGVHFFDLARWLADEDPVEVFASGSALAEPRLRRSALASSFVAALELAWLGKAELRQEDAFGPLHLRRLKSA